MPIKSCHGVVDKPGVLKQGLHRLEKYLNIQGCLEKSLKIKFTLKSTGKTVKGLEKSLNFTFSRRIQHCLLPFTGGFNTVFGDLNQFKVVVPLFGAAYAAPNSHHNFILIF